MRFYLISYKATRLSEVDLRCDIIRKFWFSSELVRIQKACVHLFCVRRTTTLAESVEREKLDMFNFLVLTIAALRPW